jgi:hypothetical protein
VAQSPDVVPTRDRSTLNRMGLARGNLNVRFAALRLES